MTDKLPSGGGRFIRRDDGELVRNTQTAPVEQADPPNPPAKPARKSTVKDK